MKFEAGKVLTVIPLEEVKKKKKNESGNYEFDGNCMVEDMIEYCGKKVTVDIVIGEKKCGIEEDEYIWTHDMFEEDKESEMEEVNLGNAENKKEKLVYISGKITGEEFYYTKFEQCENNLKEQGYKVINPARLERVLPRADYQTYMDICMIMLEEADCICMIDGWQNSKGAKIELKRALEKELEVIRI